MKSMIKRIIVGVAVGLILFFLKGYMVHAYVYVETSNGNIPIQTNTTAIVNATNTWPNSGYTFMKGNNDWLTSLGQYFYISNMNGNEIIIIADYYLGIETMSGITLPTSYLNTTRNTLTQSNLRCGIGSSYGSGYDSTNAPIISDFSVTEQIDLSANSYPHHVVRVKFKYQQKLGSNKTGGSNASCWFVKQPSNGLFIQTYGNNTNNLYFGYTSNLSVSVSGDPNTAILQNLSSQNDTMINQNNTMINQNNTIIDQNRQINTNIVNGNQQTQNKIQEQTDFLKDTTLPNSSAYDFSSNNANNGVITQLITMPISLVQAFLNGFNTSCSPFVLGNLYGTNLTLPCINLSSSLGAVWNIIDVIISGIFIYTFGKTCVRKFNDITNMKDNQIDEVFD